MYNAIDLVEPSKLDQIRCYEFATICVNITSVTIARELYCILNGSYITPIEMTTIDKSQSVDGVIRSKCVGRKNRQNDQDIMKNARFESYFGL